MGTWRITVEGQGCHHNNDARIDANLAAEEFVEKLKGQGHTLKTAKFELTDYEGKVVESEGNIDLLAGPSNGV